MPSAAARFRRGVLTALPSLTRNSALARAVVLVTLAAAIVAMRWHTYSEPHERDLDIYAWVGHYLFQGQALYRDVVDIKPPLPYLLFGVAEQLVGIGDGQVFLLGITSALATLAGLYFVGAAALRRPWVAIAAAVLWTAFGSDLYLEANQPNTESFINAFCVWAIALLWSLPADRLGPASCIGAGLLFACATLCKTVVLVPVLFLVGGEVLAAAAASRPRIIAQTTVVLATIGLIWLGVAVWLVASGGFDSAWRILWIYPGEYARHSGHGMLGNIAQAFAPQFLAPDFFVAQAGLVATCFLIIAGLLRREDRRLATRMLMWLCGIFIAVALPGHFYPHYYQLWLPWLALALALSIESTVRACNGNARTHATAVLALFGAVWAAVVLYPQIRLDPEGWSQRKYGSQFIDSRMLGRELRAELQPAQRLFVFGVFPGLYAAAGREPPGDAIVVWLALPHVGFGLSEDLSRRLLADLQRMPPDVIVLDAETWALAGPGEPIREWIAANYRTIGSRHHFSLAARMTNP